MKKFGTIEFNTLLNKVRCRNDKLEFNDIK